MWQFPNFRVTASGLSLPFDKETIQVEQCLQTSMDMGLSDAEAVARLKLCGQNVMKGQRRYTGWNVLWKQVSNAMMVILFGCLIIAFATRDYSEGGVIAGNHCTDSALTSSVCCGQYRYWLLS